MTANKSEENDMATHKRKIYLQQMGRDTRGHRLYKVLRLISSIEFSIGDILTENDVRGLCAKTYWDVDVIGFT